MVLFPGPIGRIVFNIGGNSLEFGLISDNVIIITRLPGKMRLFELKVYSPCNAGFV